MALRDAVKSPAGACSFASGLYQWLHGAGDDAAKFTVWCETVAALPRRQTRVLTWPLATIWGFIAQPERHFFLKPNVTRIAARVYGFDFHYQSKPNWEIYANLLEFAETVRADLRDLRPCDMIDLQSFLWVQGSQAGRFSPISLNPNSRPKAIPPVIVKEAMIRLVVPRLARRLLMLLLVLVGVQSLPGASGNGDAARPTSLFYTSADKRIRADFYPPTEPASGRTIVVLHGAGGTLFDGLRMRRLARALADAGDTVYVFHYFNRTGTIGARDAEMQARFDEWLETVRDGIAWANTRERGGARPIGVYGYSLGGFLAIAVASNNPLVGAVTEQAGGMWNSQERRVGKMPPVLMVHGLEDKRVPFEKYAKPLLRVLRARGGAVETEFAPREGHIFSEMAMTKTQAKAVDFFARELGAAKRNR